MLHAAQGLADSREVGVVRGLVVEEHALFVHAQLLVGLGELWLYHLIGAWLVAESPVLKVDVGL